MKRLYAILVVGAAASALLVAQGPALASTKLLQLSSDPFSNATSQHRTEVEPDTFASGRTLVSVFQVGRFFGGGASDIGFATSTDGGTSFTSGFLPGTTPFSTPGGIYDWKLTLIDPFHRPGYNVSRGGAFYCGRVVHRSHPH